MKVQQQTLFISLLVTSFVYFISSAYVICSNDGSHFALVSALVEKRSVKINDYINYTGMMDFAYKDGEFYSDRTPGTAFLSIPFYLLGKIVQETGLAKYLSSHRNINEVFVIFLPNMAGTITVLLLFKLFRFFRFNFRTSLFSSLIFAFSTLTWFESTHLFSHAISTALVLGAVYLVVTVKQFDHVHRRHLIGVSVLLALASIVEIQNVLFVGVFGLYIILLRKISLTKQSGSLLVAGLVFMAIYSTLLVYNSVAFNELTIKSNRYNPRFPEERSFLTSLSGDIFLGLDRLFTNFLNSEVIFDWSRGIQNDTPGLFVVSPILILGLIGFYHFFKSSKHEALLFLMLILAEVVVVAFHRTVLTRHISTILPLLFFPVIFVVEKWSRRREYASWGLIKRYLVLSLLLILSFLSVTRVFYVMNTYYGRSLSSPFMFAQEIPSYLVFYGSLLVVHYLFRILTYRTNG